MTNRLMILIIINGISMISILLLVGFLSFLRSRLYFISLFTFLISESLFLYHQFYRTKQICTQNFVLRTLYLELCIQNFVFRTLYYIVSVPSHILYYFSNSQYVIPIVYHIYCIQKTFQIAKKTVLSKLVHTDIEFRAIFLALNIMNLYSHIECQ